MTKKIKWRLANRPTPHEVLDLANASILTKDEAREILFSLETEEDRAKESLQDEIKFLRELVERLSKSRSQIIETIRYVEKPYVSNPWYQQYQTYCSTGTTTSAIGGLNQSLVGGGTSNLAVYTASGGTSLASGTTVTYSGSTTPAPGFTSIKTF